MKAIVYEKYGPPEVLQLQELEKPAPKDDEILIKVRATTVNYGDLVARNFSGISPRQFNMPLLFWFPTRVYFGVRNPKIKVLGSEFAGVVEAAGPGVKRFKAGDQVFGYLGQRMGAYAEYVCMPAEGLAALKPANMTFEEAASIPYGGIMALSILSRANIQDGHKVLINGASGGIGSLAVQLARYFGADVTGVCGAPRLEYVQSLGASRVIDYTQEDFTQNGETYDVIFDVLGKSSFARCQGSLTPNGRYLLASFKLGDLLQMLRTSIAGDKKVICAFADEKTENLVFIRELVEAGKIKSLIDRCYPLERAAEAHRYVEQGRKKGNVVLTWEHNS